MTNRTLDKTYERYDTESWRPDRSFCSASTRDSSQCPCRNCAEGGANKLNHPGIENNQLPAFITLWLSRLTPSRNHTSCFRLETRIFDSEFEFPFHHAAVHHGHDEHRHHCDQHAAEAGDCHRDHHVGTATR